MTDQLPSPPRPETSHSPGGVAKAVDSVAKRERTVYRRFAPTLRKLSAFAPVAAAYGAFQGVLSGQPPLSDADLHYLLAVAAGLAVGGLVGCAMLLANKAPSERLKDLGLGPANMVPSVTAHGNGMSKATPSPVIIRELSRIRPHSPRLPDLRAALLSGALRDQKRENLLCWSARLDGGGSAVPSTAHTALAVVALARIRQVSGVDGGSGQERHAMEQAVRWLAQEHNLENQTEQIRRPVTPDHMEPLTVRLFTAAWTARALLAVEAEGIEGSEALLAEAVTVVADQQHDGIWVWSDGSQPLWMAYQGISTLHALALSRFTIR